MKYLQIEYKSGDLFQYSKEEKEGFEKHESTKGNISYRNYHRQVLEGRYKGVDVDKNTPIGTQIKIILSDTNLDDNVTVSMPLYNSKGDIDKNYATSLIRFLPYMVEGARIKFYSYSLDTDGGKNIKGVSVKDESNNKYERLSMSYYDKETGKNVKGDIPAVKILGKDPLGKTQVDTKERESYLTEVLAEAAGMDEVSEKQKSKAYTKKEPKKEKPRPQTEEKDDDSLPF